MTETITVPDKEVIIKYNGWVVYKGTHEELYTPPKRGQRTYGYARNFTYEGTWIQHDHYKGTIIWASWEPKLIDNKCVECMETLSDVDLAKLMCFAKAIK